MWMLAAGAEPEPEPPGAAEAVAESPRDSEASPEVVASEGPLASGVEAAVSSARGSIFTSPATTEEWLERWESFEMPVLARLCLGWSLSEGDRERLRVTSASGMV